MTEPWGLSPAPKTTRGLRFWLVLAAAAIVVLVLLITAPVTLVILGLIAFLFALVVLLLGHARWARIPNRKVAGGLAGGAFAMVIVASIVVGVTSPAIVDAPPMAEAAADEASSPAAEPELASYVGQECDGDQLVMTQDGENNYCDDDGSGALLWVAAADHEKAEAKAAALASQEAADQVKAQEAAAAQKTAKAAQAKEAAQAKAAAEAKASKQAAAKKVAAQAAAKEKAAAQAAAKQASAQKAAQKSAQKAAQQRAAEKAAASRKSVAQQPATPKETAPSATFYKNCTAVRAAGADPIHAGDPGYSRKLDRDGDGVGCE